MGKTHRHPEFSPVQLSWNQWKFEISRHDSDYDVGFAVQQNLAPQHLRIPMKPFLPCGITQHRNLLFLIVFLLGERASHHR